MKRLAAVALLIIALAAAACGAQKQGEHMSYSGQIKSVRTVCKLTGRDALTDTMRWNVGGTDLGFPVWHAETGKMLLLFGDTFADPVKMEGDWRSNVIAVTSDADPSDGIRIDGFTGGAAEAAIQGHHNGSGEHEVTKIPTGAVEVNGAIYMFYMSVKHWGDAGQWTINYNGAAKSTDCGETWERVYDMTWVNTAEARSPETEVFINQSAKLTDGEGNITAEGREAPNYMQIFPVDGKDGYLYLFGLPGGRDGAARLARVETGSIESFARYEYFTGMKSGEAVFEKGAAADNANADNSVLPAKTGELSVIYSPALKKWMASFFTDGKIVLQTSDKLYVGWSEEITLITHREYPSLYGGMTHERYAAGNKQYFIISQWKPVYNTFVIEAEFLPDETETP